MQCLSNFTLLKVHAMKEKPSAHKAPSLFCNASVLSSIHFSTIFFSIIITFANVLTPPSVHHVLVLAFHKHRVTELTLLNTWQRPINLRAEQWLYFIGELYK
jgi:hypothetical protein